MDELADELILGAGGAELSLAVAMVRAGITRRRVVLVDPRTAPAGGEAAWSGWHVAGHGFADAVRQRWSSWRVRAGGRVIDRSCAAYPYEYVPAAALARAATAVFAAHRNVELRLGVQVGGVAMPGDWVRVDTDGGALRARRIFEGSPPPPAADGRPDGWLRHVGGWFVRTAEPVFEPERITLMDFDVPQPEGGLSFVRVLPLRHRQALIELVSLAPEPPPREHHAPILGAYLRERLGATYTITDREDETLPLAEPAPRAAPRIYRIGFVPGLARLISGRDFGAVQRLSGAYARHLAKEDLPEPPAADRGVAASLGRALLAHLKRHPERGPALFARLFDRVEPASLVRFLSGCPDGSDTLRVIGALPKLGLLSEMARARFAQRR